LENVRKAIEQERLVLADAEPIVAPDDFGFSRLSIAELATLQELLSKSVAGVAKMKTASADDVASSVAASHVAGPADTRAGKR
jgi:hypothetical protein